MRKISQITRKVALLIAVAMLSVRVSNVVAQDPPKGLWEGHFPDVTLKTQDNKEVRFYEDLIKGKIVVMNLMYTSCDSKL